MPVLFAPFEKNFAGPTSKNDVKLTLADLHAIPLADRYWGMSSTVSEDADTTNRSAYQLAKGHLNENLADNGNWKKVGSGSGSTMVETFFDANGTTTDFTIAPYDELSAVEINGQKQYKTLDWTPQNGGLTVRFNTAPVSGKICIRTRIGTPNLATYSKTEIDQKLQQQSQQQQQDNENPTIVEYTNNYTVLATDKMLIVNSALGAINVQLPEASVFGLGKELHVYNDGGGIVRILPKKGEMIGRTFSHKLEGNASHVILYAMKKEYTVFKALRAEPDTMLNFVYAFSGFPPDGNAPVEIRGNVIYNYSTNEKRAFVRVENADDLVCTLIPVAGPWVYEGFSPEWVHVYPSTDILNLSTQPQDASKIYSGLLCLKTPTGTNLFMRIDEKSQGSYEFEALDDLYFNESFLTYNELYEFEQKLVPWNYRPAANGYGNQSIVQQGVLDVQIYKTETVVQVWAKNNSSQQLSINNVTLPAYGNDLAQVLEVPVSSNPEVVSITIVDLVVNKIIGEYGYNHTELELNTFVSFMYTGQDIIIKNGAFKFWDI